MLEMCWLSDMSEDRMKPKLRAWSENEMDEVPTVMLFGKSDLSDFVLIKSASVLSSLSFRRFSDIHCLTSVMHACMD